ncbi:MAG TPA: hypothetical protein ACFYD2_05820 [Candidatus Avalokitesvara rifleensis]|uniref:hypothetical protein n=1 Tax=Candidatus Avalokitesvara rifleensis TaxID=3367620 RepID=UPI0027131C53|nr:hypothetical protein [Candidatus Brocadiales bacterium]
MRMPLYAVLVVLISGCGMMGSGGKQTRMDATEQQVAVVIERLGTIEEANEEVMKNIEALSKDKSTSQRLSVLEEKQANMEKMQLELISYQESLKGSLAKMREYTEALKQKVDELAGKQEAEVTEKRRRLLEERLRQEVDEDVKIQEIPRDKIIKIEKPPAQPKIEEMPSPPLVEEMITAMPKAEEGTSKQKATPEPPKAEKGAPGDVKRKAASEPPKKEGAAEGGFILEDF